MKRALTVVAGLLIASSSIAQVANGPRFGLDGSVHAPTSTYSINGTTGDAKFGNLKSAGGSQTAIDLTGVGGNNVYLSGAAAIHEYYPVVGWQTGDHQRAMNIINFNSQFDASRLETALAINVATATGFSYEYANSTNYAAGDYVLANGAQYRATAAGTSAATGTGPSGTGSAITDGTAVFAYVGASIVNGKTALFISDVASPGSGHVWASTTDLVLEPGYNGGLGTTAEFDQSNFSGSDCSACQTVFITGTAGANKIGSGLSMFNPDPTNYAYINGIQVTGNKLATNADIKLNTTAQYGVQDVGTHSWGFWTSNPIQAGSFIAGGLGPMLSGPCTAGSLVGGNTAGSFNLTGSGCSASSLGLTFAKAAPTGWACSVTDMTSGSAAVRETAYTANSVTFTFTGGAAGDQVVFSCTAF